MIGADERTQPRAVQRGDLGRQPREAVDENDFRAGLRIELLARRQEGTAIIFISAELDEIIAYSDRIVVFSAGNATLVDDPADMTTNRLGELIGGRM